MLDFLNQFYKEWNCEVWNLKIILQIGENIMKWNFILKNKKLLHFWNLNFYIINIIYLKTWLLTLIINLKVAIFLLIRLNWQNIIFQIILFN